MEELMSKNKKYVKQLMAQEGYERPIVAFKLCNKEPERAEAYGTDVSFLCAITAEVWDEDKPFYITNDNIICGGAVYCGLGAKPINKEDFDDGMELVIGKNKAYATRKVMRRVNQQYPHFFTTHKYLLLGKLEQIEDPDMVMIVADAHKVMRLCKAYTWKTGELVRGIQGTAWCTQTFPIIYREKTITCNLGDPPARALMQLKEGEMYCAIHYDLLPLIINNLKNISSGELF